MNKKINTIYIISKGRPSCRTAKTLTKMGYTGEWFIVCGNNDETIDEYKNNWGEDRILIFDWYNEVKKTDLLDNFGVEKMSSGAVPVRNATRTIAANRGEIRHWQFDDDYTAFYHIKDNKIKWHRLLGQNFENELYKLAEYADKSKLTNIGFAVASDTRPETVKAVGHRVFNAHNMPTDLKLFTKWKSRMNDDLINAIETYRKGGYELFVKYMNINMPPTQSESGGNTDIYLLDGTVRKAAYAIIIEPKNVKLTIMHGRYHHRANWRRIIPKILHTKYA
jgi:hypothetical protein|tara:strand:+ start:69 stop:905 length:837 start_codon:yes stop_codon:yes gene_type:complete